MNTDQNSFTGRRRHRKTSKAIHIKNIVAKYCITLGGILTIVSILLVAFFLVYVVIPLFLPPSLEFEKEVTFSELFGDAKLLKVGSDDYLTIGYVILDDSSVITFDLKKGALIARQKFIEEQNFTSIAFSNENNMVAIGYDDGSIRIGGFEFENEFLALDDLPDRYASLDTGETEVYEAGVVERLDRNQFRKTTPAFSFAEPVSLSEGNPVLLLDISTPPRGEQVAALTADGNLHLARILRRTNLLTGHETISLSNGNLQLSPATLAEKPSWIKLSGLGNQLYLVFESGKLLRYNSSSLDDMYLAETVELLQDSSAKVTAVEFQLGKTSLLIGDSSGGLNGWFGIKPEGFEARDGIELVNAHKIDQAVSPVTTIATSHRSRKAAAGFEDGSVRLYLVTSDTLLAESWIGDDKGPVLGLAISGKEDYLIAFSESLNTLWQINAPHPETTLSSMLLPVWYEGYEKPAHVWQTSSATDDFEPKYGLWPLIFGTLKATFYSLLFGVPIALLAAIYTSEFLHPKRKSLIKPTVEMMASLPSVVLGFLAGLVLAPIIENVVPEVLTGIFTIPICLLFGAFLWQLIPQRYTVMMSRFRLSGVLLTVPLGIWVASLLGKPVERWLFAGNIKAWLNSQVGTGFGGWMLLLLPFSGLIVAALMATVFAPFFRRMSGSMSGSRYAMFDIGKFLAGLILTILLAVLLSQILTAIGLDPRGSYIDTYIQRNALIVGFIMGFAIIPIIYTISEDALSAVPDHLRAGSLGAGATNWQTAVRIIIPTAMSGLFSAIMIGLGRAVGETMIVLMAAGNTPILEMNIFNGFRTLSANIAVELPEAVQNSTHYRSLFLAALVLFIITFLINTLAEIVRQRFRRRSSQL